jgi:hypothetical protein
VRRKNAQEGTLPAQTAPQFDGEPDLTFLYSLAGEG